MKKYLAYSVFICYFLTSICFAGGYDISDYSIKKNPKSMQKFDKTQTNEPFAFTKDKSSAFDAKEKDVSKFRDNEKIFYGRFSQILTEDLNLSEEQQEKIDAIFRENRKDIKNRKKIFYAKLNKLEKNTDKKINSLLNKEQKSKFNEIFSDKENKTYKLSKTNKQLIDSSNFCVKVECKDAEYLEELKVSLSLDEKQIPKIEKILTKNSRNLVSVQDKFNSDIEKLPTEEELIKFFLTKEQKVIFEKKKNEIKTEKVSKDSKKDLKGDVVVNNYKTEKEKTSKLCENIEKIKKDLKLSPTQTKKIEKILKDKYENIIIEKENFCKNIAALKNQKCEEINKVLNKKQKQKIEKKLNVVKENDDFEACYNLEFKSEDILKELKEKLNLSKKQSEKIEKILKDKCDKIAMEKESFDKKKIEIQKEKEDLIKEILNKKQKIKFEKIKENKK